MNISPKFSALYIFSPEKTQDVLKFKDQFDLEYSSLSLDNTDDLEEMLRLQKIQAEMKDTLIAEASTLGKKESDTLFELTGDDTFQKQGHKNNPFIIDNQGRIDGLHTRGGLLSDGRLFVATNPSGEQGERFDYEIKDTDSDVTFWDKVQHVLAVARWEKVMEDPNMERTEHATEHMIPDTVHLEAQMAGRNIIEIA